ncbi:DNA-binding protein [Arthrobacter cheniae]|uniref:DNA-binding protein n=1 Tax=Arthrobacter cheniae TaxID=1258888 RepID=A0A3A5M606_9MICC|nr:DNA-binding protein [Arthrobacter cheniae]
MQGTAEATPTEWLSPQQIANELGITVRTYYEWRTKGKAPRALRIGKHLRTSRADFDSWIEERRER